MFGHPTAIPDEQADAAHLGVHIESIAIVIDRFAGRACGKEGDGQRQTEKASAFDRPKNALLGRHELEA